MTTKRKVANKRLQNRERIPSRWMVQGWYMDGKGMIRSVWHECH